VQQESETRKERGGVGARGEGLGRISGWWRGIESGDGDVGCHETRNLQPIWSGGTGGKGDRHAKWNSARGNQGPLSFALILRTSE